MIIAKPATARQKNGSARWEAQKTEAAEQFTRLKRVTEMLLKRLILALTQQQQELLQK